METIEKLLNNIIFIKRKPMELGKEIFCLLSGFRLVVDRQFKNRNELLPRTFHKEALSSSEFGKCSLFSAACS